MFVCFPVQLFVWGYPAEGRLGLGNVTAYGPPIEMIHRDRRDGVKPGPLMGVTVPVPVSFFNVNRIMGAFAFPDYVDAHVTA